MCMFCRSLFVLLYLFFWPLCCLFFFDIRILITLWYLLAIVFSVLPRHTDSDYSLVSFGHCVVSSSSTYGFWLLFDIFKLLLLTLGFNGISNNFEKLTYTYISLVLSLSNGIPCILENLIQALISIATFFVFNPPASGFN